MLAEELDAALNHDSEGELDGVILPTVLMEPLGLNQRNARLLLDFDSKKKAWPDKKLLR
jgi:hypothetical protein